MSTVASATQGGFLSPELIGRIIDEVHLFSDLSETSDYDSDEGGETNSWDAAIPERLSSLTSCSLVCRTWLAGSRYHIFGTTTVSFYNHASFMKLIGSSRNTFLAFVHTLRLNENIVPGDLDRPDLGSSYFWLHLFLPTGFLSEFANLKTLRISEARFDWAFGDTLADGILGTCNLPSITNLTLHQCHFHTMNDAMQILSSWTALVSVPVRHLFRGSGRDASDQFRPPQPSPSVVVIAEYPCSYLPFTCTSLVDGNDSDTVDLQCLTDNIEYCLNLESIAFCPVYINSLDARYREEHVKNIPTILQRITSTSITDIILTVCVHSVANFDIFNWVSITEILVPEPIRSPSN
ncbi:hypothetical protein F5146DRAFT_1228423 [Armillaria mellea]|nr:hypothetical protein F5146DRAFT_1228423 [Armillaria mellea]